ncbi:hypothetical protein EVAR_19128_1 [Eumeta japonica]|uniref:Uncharacterized protein n=1 Tax=Eumeta variegata TaxID=151549 RepID=A0A4C1SSF6_EUMVA|nr:hypothetical protein EVAR_19128_1 [Eumeta japonica]
MSESPQWMGAPGLTSVNHPIVVSMTSPQFRPSLCPPQQLPGASEGVPTLKMGAEGTGCPSVPAASPSRPPGMAVRRGVASQMAPHTRWNEAPPVDTIQDGGGRIWETAQDETRDRGTARRLSRASIAMYYGYGTTQSCDRHVCTVRTLDNDLG